MWTTVVCVAALSLAPGQAGRLALVNVRPTYGPLGSARPDHTILPGDVYYLSFDIDGLRADGAGKARYTIALDVADASGKTIFKQDPQAQEATSAFGGTRIPASIRLSPSVEQRSGSYTLKLTVTDPATRASQSLEQTVQVLPKAFGLVQLAVTADPDGQIPVPFIGAPGQTLHVHALAVGFGRDRSKKQPNVSVEMRILDDQGKPTMAKPFSGVVNENVAENAPLVPLPFTLPLTRAGKFTVELKATDQVSGKTAQLSFPLTVLERK
jgi:hypothetical protein